jgi:hypothetical protein
MNTKANDAQAQILFLFFMDGNLSMTHAGHTIISAG